MALSLPIASKLARGFSTSACRNAIKDVTIIGGGLMGSGIAQVAAQAGHNVIMVDTTSELLKKAEVNIETSLGRIAKKLYKEDPSAGQKFIQDTKSRIQGTTDVKEAVKGRDLVLEAIVENIDIKQKLFKEIDGIADQKTIFASNTSSLSIGEMAAVTNRKDRFGGLHFFSPVPMMKLLEVVKLPETSEETYKALMAWGKAIGKTCITCKDTPGFVVNRLLVPQGNEAFKMLERGDATAEDIDIAMKLGVGHPMGPFELADFTGIDIGLSVLEGWHNKFPDNPLFKPSELQKKLVKEGKLGKKTGEGIYKYTK